jgi:hypothetical protein
MGKQGQDLDRVLCLWFHAPATHWHDYTTVCLVWQKTGRELTKQEMKKREIGWSLAPRRSREMPSWAIGLDRLIVEPTGVFDQDSIRQAVLAECADLY